MFDQQVTFLGVRNLGESAAFYEDQLGLSLFLDQGTCRIYRVSADGFLGICEGSSKIEVSTEGMIVTLVSQDVDGWYERLKAKGVVFEEAPAENAKFNIYHCFLRDPDGHLLEIQRFNAPEWPKPR